MQSRSYSNANVYITGGSSGIGLEAAKRFSSLGANVFIFSRTEEHLKVACREISDCKISDSQTFEYRVLDVAVGEDVRSVMAAATASFGPPDILINCAGRAYPHYFKDISTDQLHETMAVNFYGMWYTIRALVPHMQKSGGRIVNVASMAGFMGIFGYTDYSASKFAVMGFSEALRSELKSYGIQVSVLCPPDTDTPGFHTENKTKPVETALISGTVKPMPVAVVARAMIAGMEKRKAVIIPGLEGKFVYGLKRLVPGLVEKIMDHYIQKAQR